MNICVPYFFLLPFPTPNKSVHSTAWTLWSLGRHRLPAPQWVRLHYCHIMAGAAPAIDVATTLYKAALSPGGRLRLRDARMGRMADPFGVAEPGPLLFPCKSIDWTAVFSIASSGPGSSQPFQGLNHFSARNRGHPIVAVVQCNWTTVCCFGVSYASWLQLWGLTRPLRDVWALTGPLGDMWELLH